MIKFVLGVLLVLTAIWVPFYIWTFLPENWNQLWYAFPLFITTVIIALTTGIMGIGTIVEVLDA